MWKAIKGFVWWTHPRGSMQYDVMVSLILAFIFVSPHFVDFRDKPSLPLHPLRIISTFDPDGNTVYLVPVEAVAGSSDLSSSLTKVVSEVAGPEAVERYEQVRDNNGDVEAYRVWVKH